MRKLAAVLSLFVLSGCYHTIVKSGLAPSTTTIDKPWAHSFVAGLVPPAPVETAGKCAKGIAMVETQHSFPNLLVGFLTASIYTPVSIRVTCAQ